MDNQHQHQYHNLNQAPSLLLPGSGLSGSDSNNPSANPTNISASSSKPRKPSATKITRNRKINSCLVCRDRKQKCDRVHPICGSCASSKNPGGCVYVDDTFVQTSNKGKPAQVSSSSTSDSTSTSTSAFNSSKRKNSIVNEHQNGQDMNPSTDEGELSARMSKIMGKEKEKEASLFAHGNEVYYAGPNSSTSYLERRRELIPTNLVDQAQKSIENQSQSPAITSRYFSFEERIRSTRSLAIGEVLEDNDANETLKLPDFETLLYILEAYQNNIEWHYDFVNVSLLLFRIKDFHEWWINRKKVDGMDGNWNTEGRDGNQEDEFLKNLPPDPVLVPMLFAILAIGLQCIRTTGSKERGGNGLKDSTTAPDQGSNLSGADSRTEFLSQSILPNSFSRYTPRSKSSPSSKRLFANCSSEKEFLKISLECSESLQTSCPSNFSSAYQAPLDLIRTHLLVGIWHTSELNLQFACSSFAIATRLSHSAGLNRDPKMWNEKIEKFEAFNRRTLWWSVVFFSVFHSSRLGIPPDLRPNGFDTELPNDHKTKAAIWRRFHQNFQNGKMNFDLSKGHGQTNQGSYTSSYPSALSISSSSTSIYSDEYSCKFPKLFNLKPPTYQDFQFHLCRYKLAHCFLLQNEKLFALKLPRHEIVEVLDLVYKKWRKEVPDFLKTEWLGKDSIKSPSPDPDPAPDTHRNDGYDGQNHVRNDDNEEKIPVASSSSSSPSDNSNSKSKEEIILERNQKEIETFQSSFLQVGYLQGTLQIHRPYLDEAGAWKEPREAKKSLEMCLNAACSLIWLMVGLLDSKPPHWISNIMVQHTFSSSSILAIHIQVQDNIALHSKSKSKSKSKDQDQDQPRSEPNPLKATLEKGLEILDTFNRKKSFGNISEQAGRYAATIRELLGFSPQEGSIGPGGAASQIGSNNPSSGNLKRNQVWNHDARAQFPSTNQVRNQSQQNQEQKEPSIPISITPTPTPFAAYYDQPPPEILQRQQQVSQNATLNAALELPPFDPAQPVKYEQQSLPQQSIPIQALSPASAYWLSRPLEGIPPDRPLPPPPGKANSPLPSRILMSQERSTMELDQPLMNPDDQGFGSGSGSGSGNGIPTWKSQSARFENVVVNSNHQNSNLTIPNPMSGFPQLQGSLPARGYPESNYSTNDTNTSHWSPSINDTSSVSSRNNSISNSNSNSSYEQSTNFNAYNYPMNPISGPDPVPVFNTNQTQRYDFDPSPGQSFSGSQASFNGNYTLNSNLDFVENGAADYVQEWKLWESYCEELKNQRNESVY